MMVRALIALRDIVAATLLVAVSLGVSGCQQTATPVSETAAEPAPKDSVAAETNTTEPAAEDIAGGDGIVAHPSQLRFPELTFAPPKASDHTHVLPSGVTAIVVEDHALPLVDVTVLIRAGAYLEPAGKEGLADAVGSLLRSAGAGDLAASDFDEELDFLAANMGSSLGSTTGAAEFNCLTKDFDRVLELFVSMLRSPRFDADRFEVYRARELQRLGRRNDRAEAIEAREWNRIVRGDNWHSADRTTKASVESLTRDDLLAFHKQWIHPRNFVLAIAGDVETKAVLEKISAAFADWPAGGEVAPAIPTSSTTPKPGLYLVDKTDVNQGRVTMGHLAVKRDHPDYHALVVMNHILGGGGFTSRIMSRVRSDKGLAYSAGSSLRLGKTDSGTFSIGFQSKTESVAEAAATALAEVDRIRAEPVTPQELSIAIEYLVGVFPRFFASASGVASTFADDVLTPRPDGFYETYRDKIKAVTAADVQRVAKEHLDRSKLAILAVGPVEGMLAGNPDAPSFSLEKLSPVDQVTRVPLPDPESLEYPESP